MRKNIPFFKSLSRDFRVSFVQVVAPFGGSIMLTDNDNEVMIINSGELPPGSELIITNIVPDGEIQHPTEDELYVERMVM